MASSDTKPLKYKFKSAGVDSLERKITSQEILEQVLPPLGIKTPLELATDANDSLFKSHRNIEDLVQDNLRNLLLTNKGERLGRYDYGASLRNMTFELINSDNFENEVMTQIQGSVEKYLPFVELKNFNASIINFPENDIKSIATVSIEIEYDVPTIKIVSKKINLKLFIGG